MKEKFVIQNSKWPIWIEISRTTFNRDIHI